MDKASEVPDLLREIRELLRALVLRDRFNPGLKPVEVAPDRALLSPREFAKLLGVSTITLKKWRREEKGPAWVKMERTVRYERSAIDDWIKSRKKE